MPLNLNSDKLFINLNSYKHVIVCKPDYHPVSITGATQYNFIASGETHITQVSHGNVVDVTIYNPSGSSATWGLIVGDITNQTDLINYVVEEISGATSGLTSSWGGLTGQPTDNVDLVDLLSGYSLTSHTHTQYVQNTEFDTYTGDTEIILTGLTSGLNTLETQVGDLDTAFNTHTGDTSIHYEQSAISITESQINDFGNYALQSDLTGLTSSFDTHTGNTSIHFSGHTFTPSGITQITLVDDNVIIYTPADSLTGITWGSITGDISTQTDLQLALDAKSNTGHTHPQYALDSTVTGLTSSFTSHTGDTSIHYEQSAISITESQISDFGNYALESDLTGVTSTVTSHTGDTSIHYQQSAITITESQINDFGNYALQSDLTGLTSSFDTHTGDTTIHFPQSAITITESQISDFGNYALQSGLTGLTSSFDSHTGNTSIHYTMAQITGFTSNSTFSTYTGTTAPATYAPIVHVHSQYLTGGTNMGTTSVIHGTSVSGQKLQLKGLAAQDAKIVVSADTTNVKIGFGSVALTNLSNVNCPTPSDNDILKYSGSTWVNEAATDIFATVADTQLLARNGTVITGVTQSKFATSASIVTYTGTTAPATYAGKASIVTYTGTTMPANYITHGAAVTNLNDALLTSGLAKGSYRRYASTATNKPALFTSNSNGVISYATFNADTQYGWQFTFQTNGNQMFSRYLHNSSWSSWLQIAYADRLITYYNANVTVTLAMNGATLLVNGTRNITLPTGATMGFNFEVIQYGTAGNVLTFVPPSGATVITPNGSNYTISDTGRRIRVVYATTAGGRWYVDTFNDKLNKAGDTMTGALQINDNGTTGTTANWLRLNSQNKVEWSAGDEVGRIDFWTPDTSGIGAHLCGQILLENIANAQTTPRCAMVFKTGTNNAVAEERMRIDNAGNVTITGSLTAAATNIVSIATATTLNATHAGKTIEASGTFTITLPNSMITGMKVDIVNVGTGTITIAASTTLQSKNSKTKLETQYGGASVYHRGSNVWLAVGDLT